MHFCNRCEVSCFNISAQVKDKSRAYGNALQAVSSRGHKDVAQMLLENGADVNG